MAVSARSKAITPAGYRNGRALGGAPATVSRCAGRARAGLLAGHQTANTIQPSRAMLKTKPAVLTTSLSRARLGLNAMRHGWWQPCGGVDLDQAVEGGAAGERGAWR
jgi:hypothetical protein